MKRLLVLGAGMQGVAAAYDSAAFGAYESIVLADLDIVRAIDGAERVNRLLSTRICDPARFDASNPKTLHEVLPEFDIAIGALPYPLHFLVENVAIDIGCSVVDMGIDTEEALDIHSCHKEAVQKGCTIVTDCGLAPGLVNILGADLIGKSPNATHIRAYCGGLPERPVGPLGYVLRFSMDSVIGEYSEEVIALREGQVIAVPPLDLVEELKFDGIGTLEAFTTSGGAGTAPYSFRSKVPNYEYKTLRYPGHLAAMKLFRDCGFWSEEQLPRIGHSARESFSAVMEKNLSNPDIKDIVIVRVESESPGGISRLEMLAHQDPLTGFTAMERLTGFSTSIVALEIANRRIGPGCFGCEVAVDSARFQAELSRRGLDFEASTIPHHSEGSLSL